MGVYMKALSPIVVLTSILLLQGCVATTMISTAAICTVVATDPRTVSTQFEDNKLEFYINNVILKNKQIKKNARIKAVVYQGKVILAGQVQNAYLALQAKNIAMKINGVTEVFNEIRQDQPIDLITISSDIWITTKLRLQLLGSNQVKSSNVRVMTENGEVFLLGLVTEKEGKAAANIASCVNGVKRVNIAFTYIR